LENRTPVVVLQHPQEPDRALGTAPLLVGSLKRSALRVGLSWANLSKAVGKELDARRWAVLHLGSGLEGVQEPGLYGVTKEGVSTGKVTEAAGLVVLDGTWSQAKALWWRNAWLLKLQRVSLVPRRASAYGVLRKEPRKEALSTLEAAAQALVGLGEDPTIEVELSRRFEVMLAGARALLAASRQAERGNRTAPVKEPG
jgi:DTW domain-containing protein YfiP